MVDPTIREALAFLSTGDDTSHIAQAIELWQNETKQACLKLMALRGRLPSSWEPSLRPSIAASGFFRRNRPGEAMDAPYTNSSVSGPVWSRSFKLGSGTPKRSAGEPARLRSVV